MVANVRDLASVLNRLIQVSKDSQDEFREAGMLAHEPDVRVSLLSLSQQRLLFVSDLQQIVEAFQQDAVTRGTWGGALHRRWTGLRAMIATQADDVLLGECERSEELVLRAYDDALGEDLPLEVRSILQRQRDLVGTALAGLGEQRVSRRLDM